MTKKAPPPLWIKNISEGSLLHLMVQPGASKNEFAGVFPGKTGDLPRLKIKIQSPPVDGAANKALVSFLSKILEIPKTRIELVRGETSRIKDVMVKNAPAEWLYARLEEKL